MTNPNVDRNPFPGSTSLSTTGYYLANENAEHFVGGLLVLNENARPLEFHCTAPVRPSQSQRILYGATLAEHVLCELIPKLLINKTRQKPSTILVDRNPLLGCRKNIDVPVGCLSIEKNVEKQHRDEDRSLSSSIQAPADSELVIGDSAFISAGGFEFTIHTQFRSDESVVLTALESISKTVDIDEPFERLATAIQEASKSSGKAA